MPDSRRCVDRNLRDDWVGSGTQAMKALTADSGGDVTGDDGDVASGGADVLSSRPVDHCGQHACFRSSRTSGPFLDLAAIVRRRFALALA